MKHALTCCDLCGDWHVQALPDVTEVEVNADGCWRPVGFDICFQSTTADTGPLSLLQAKVKAELPADGGHPSYNVFVKYNFWLNMLCKPCPNFKNIKAFVCMLAASQILRVCCACGSCCVMNSPSMLMLTGHCTSLKTCL